MHMNKSPYITYMEWMYRVSRYIELLILILVILGGEQQATHSGIVAWRIPRTEETGRLQSMGFQELDAAEVTEAQHACYRLYCLWLRWFSL